VRDDDFVDAQLSRWNVERQWDGSIRVEINLIAMIQNVALCARRCADLLRDRFFLPPLPREKHIPAIVEPAAFAIKEEKDVVFEDGNEIAKLLAVGLVGIRIRPKIQKRPVAKPRQILFSARLSD
jgi:hypothetical protein